MIDTVESKKYGFKINFDSEDNMVGRSIANDTYEPYESELFLSKIKKDSIVFDVGANIGYYSLLASLRIKNEGWGDVKVFAFEPNSKNFSLLKKNIEINGLTNARCFNTAVGDHEGESKLYLSKENQGDHQLYHSEGRDSEPCPVITIDYFSQRQKVIPTMVKIDTQGYDLFVLRGMEQLLKSSNRIALFTEFWDYGNKKSGALSIDYYNFLKTYFKKINFIDEQRERIYPVDFNFIMNICSQHNNYMHANLYCEQ